MAIDSAPADPAKHRAPLGKASSGNQKGEALGTSGAGRVQSTAGDVALTRSFEQKKRQVFLFSRNFPDRRLVAKSLQSFFGIGPAVSSQILARFHLHSTMKMRELSPQQVLDLNAALDGMKIENELKRSVLQDIKRLRDTGTYRGRRHAMNLPVRGQNTRSQIKSAWRLNMVERRL